MSGGRFQYNQYKIGYIADEIEQLIFDNNSTEKDEYGDVRGHHFRPDTIAKFREALYVLRKAQSMAHRIDWLVSGDDGEDSFHKRWDEDMQYVWEQSQKA